MTLIIIVFENKEINILFFNKPARDKEILATLTGEVATLGTSRPGRSSETKTGNMATRNRLSALNRGQLADFAESCDPASSG